MSERIHTSITNATPYNAKTIPMLFNGSKTLPSKYRRAEVLQGCQDLFDRQCGSDLFTRAVLKLQQNLGFPEHAQDAKFGRGTYGALLGQFDPITDNYITIAGCRYEIAPTSWKMVCFDEPDGLDLHRRGHFSGRKGSTIKNIVVHWGGLNPKHFYNVAMSPSRKISTHFGIGKGEDGIVRVYQFLDLEHSAWHGGKINKSSVGIDICQQADPKWLSYYQDSGLYDVELVDNPTSRGSQKIISLDPEIRWAVSDFVSQLMQILHDETDDFDSSRQIPEADSLIDNPSRYSIIGHHHLRKTKWDVACWFDELFKNGE